MKKWIYVLFILSIIFLLSCTLVETEKIVPQSNAPEKIISEPLLKNDAKAGLGDLCSGEEQCREFCSKNRGRCESYCRGKEIELCRIIFPPDSNTNDIGPQINNGCSGKGIITFTTPPMRLEDIGYIEPMGLMIGGHVTPIDHGYYTAKTWVPGTPREASKFVDIFAPAAGIVTSVEAMPAEYASSSIGDYRLIIYHTCTFYTIYIHVNQLTPKLQSIVGTGRPVSVESGEVIGKAPGFDFSVHNDEITLSGFIEPESYFAEPWKLHNVDMFDYFAEPLRTQLLERNVRQKEPRGGKIDYDVDGKLVGNWFEENTNGYFGKKEYNRMSGYWSTHLAFAYDGLDPSLIIISIGDYAGEAQQFAVKGNTPDPKDISLENGPVKYELVPFGYKTESGEEWERWNFAKVTKAYGLDEQVSGVALVQMIEQRKIKFEAYPGKIHSEVKSFTEKAKIYER